MERENGKIKAVFFDLGKVILRFRHEDIIERLLTHTPYEDRRPGELFEYLFDMKDGLCNLYDEGNISSEEFFRSIDKRFGLGMDYAGFVPLWNDIFTEISGVSALVRMARAKRPVYLLSNVNELHWEYVKDRFPVLAGMDGHVLSYVVKAKKPAPAIYAAAMEMAGVGPGESVFIDDLPENAVAATECGIKGIIYTGPEALKAELSTLELI